MSNILWWSVTVLTIDVTALHKKIVAGEHINYFCALKDHVFLPMYQCM